MMIADVKIKKVNHRTEADSVDQVSNGAAEYKGKAGCKKLICPGGLVVEVENQSHSHRRDKEKNNSAHYRTHIGHEAERPARIKNVGDIKDAVNNCNAMVQRQIF